MTLRSRNAVQYRIAIAGFPTVLRKQAVSVAT